MAIANITGNILTDSGVVTSSLLPLTGGTLTGALNGTNAVFSGFLGVNGSPGTAFPFEAYINSSTAYTTSSRGNLLRVYNSNTGANVFAGIELGGAGTANDGLAGINGIVTGSGSAALSFYTRDGGTFAERVRVAANGNVGIGSNNPGYPLIISRTLSSEQTLLNIDNATNTQNNFGMNFSVLGYLPVAAIRVMYPAENNLSLAFFTYNGAGNVNERMRLSQAGNLLFTGGVSTGVTDTKFLMISQGTTSSTFAMVIKQSNNSTNLFALRDDGVFFTGTAAASPYNNTYGNAANVYIGSDGAMGRSTSSIKYKENVLDYNKGLAEVMQLRPVSYTSKNQQEEGQTFAGLIAEEVHDLGLTEFVQYAEDGTPDALAYQNMVALLTKSIQELKAQNDDLQSQINELKAQ